jgi:hypothetical protein
MDANKDMPISVLAGKTIEVKYHSGQNYLEIYYQGGITPSEEFREASEKSLKFAIEKSVKRWFIDQTNMSIHPNDQKWFFEDFQPRLGQALGEGRRTAIVLAKNLFTEFSIKQENKRLLEKKAPEEMQVYFSKTREDALNWLLNLSIES